MQAVDYLGDVDAVLYGAVQLKLKLGQSPQLHTAAQLTGDEAAAVILQHWMNEKVGA